VTRFAERCWEGRANPIAPCCLRSEVPYLAYIPDLPCRAYRVLGCLKDMRTLTACSCHVMESIVSEARERSRISPNQSRQAQRIVGIRPPGPFHGRGSLAPASRNGSSGQRTSRIVLPAACSLGASCRPTASAAGGSTKIISRPSCSIERAIVPRNIPIVVVAKRCTAAPARNSASEPWIRTANSPCTTKTRANAQATSTTGAIDHIATHRTR
jgi:hypothetical protein